MNNNRIGELIRLRYKLMWAKTRTRNGKIALFFTGYILLVLVIAVLTSGGIGAAALAIRSGRAEFVTRLVLTSLFAQALLATVLMGFGMGAIFSDLELRRYAVSAAERVFVRHLIGILDPFWFLTLALELGLVVGLYVFGATNVAAGFVAVLLLMIANYLTARVIEMVVDRLMQRPAGSTLVMVGVVCLSLSGAVIPPLVNKYPGAVRRLVDILVYTPPFGAAAAMTRGGAALISGYGIELVWIVGLAALLIWFERRPVERRAAESVKMTFESPYDRVAAALGFEHAPLVGWWLRFYSRNSRFKAMILLSLPLVAFLTFNFGGRKGGIGLFNAAMGTMPVVTFIATSRFMVNLFGYLGGGYRRCFLLPVPPAVVLRTGSYASMVLSTPFIPAALIAWVAFAPVPFDAREVFMLACSSTTALFVFHALGLFGTLYGPRKGNYNQSLGNDLSLIGNIILIGGVLGCMFGPMLLVKVAPGFLSPANWWMWPAAPVLGAAIYYGSLSAASAAVGPRREYLMAVVEGRAS